MRLVVLIWLVVGVTSVRAQFHSYTIRNYKAVDGLPQSQVNIMLEDKNGYLWIGTEGGGLARFDGRDFEVYTTLDGLLSNIVSYLKLDEQQNLWIIHPRGITKFDGTSFKKFQQPGSHSNMRRIRKAFELQDTLFFISAPGYLGKIHNDSVYYWSKPLRDNVLIQYSHLTVDKRVLMYLSDSTFYVHDKNGVTDFKHSRHFNRVFGMMFNYENETWVRTDSGYFVVDVATKRFTKKTLPFETSIVHYDSLNDVFWARNASSLLKVKINNGKVQTDTVVKDVNVRQILIDSEGNTWFATSGAGLYKYFIQDFDRCSSDNMQAVMAIHKDRLGSTWIGTANRGLWRMKGGKATNFFDRENSGRNSVTSISESPSGEIWAGTGYGLGQYIPEKNTFRWYTRDDGLSNVSILGGVAFDDKGGLWIGTHSGGVNYFDGERFTAYTTQNGLPTNTVNAIHFSNVYQSLFIGNEFGLSQLKDGVCKPLSIQGLENTTVLSIHPYRDSLLLLGSGGAGVAIYQPRTHFQKLLTGHAGLPSGFIYFVAADSDDYLWVGSEKGITRLKLDNNLEIIENLHFDHENGLAGMETNQNAFFLSSEKKYFGLIDGLYQYNNQTPKKTPFGLHLTDIQILYGESSVRDFSEEVVGFFKIPLDPKIPPDQNHITFHFNKVNKRYPKSVKFKYYLENFDKAWSQASSLNHVTYGNIPPGKYVFHVVATDADGSWNTKEFTYTFTVLAPFYKTPAFIACAVLLLAGLVTLIMYLRVKQRVNAVVMRERIRTREQEALRKEIARDFHDEMGNQLTRIINYVSLLKLNGSVHGSTNGNGHKAHEDIYTKVENSAKYLYSGTRDFIWSIDPVNDELGKLFIHIRDFGEKLFEEKQIHFRAFNEIKDSIKLPHGFSREANLIFKEAMTNAFKYSQAKNVNFTLTKTIDNFELKLEDDGIGFSTNDIKVMNGLKNMRDRSDRIHADFRVESHLSQGTAIIINFKLNKTPKYGNTF